MQYMKISRSTKIEVSLRGKLSRQGNSGNLGGAKDTIKTAGQGSPMLKFTWKMPTQIIRVSQGHLGSFIRTETKGSIVQSSCRSRGSYA